MAPGDLTSFEIHEGSTVHRLAGRVVCLAAHAAEPDRATLAVVDTGVPTADSQRLPDQARTLAGGLVGLGRAIVVVRGSAPPSDPPTVHLMMSIDRLSVVIDASGSALLRELGLCPRCGNRGVWFTMCCCCPDHGRFLG